MAWLELQLAAMREEVRTRRLVVTEEDGFERVVAQTEYGTGVLRVRGRTVRGDDGVEREASVEMYVDDGGSSVPGSGVAAWAGGNPAASMDSGGTFLAYSLGDGGPGMELTHRGLAVHDQQLLAARRYWEGIRSGRIDIYDE